MSATTQIWKREQMRRRPLVNCHDGQGAVDWTDVLPSPADRGGSRLRFLHDDVLPPGTSVGEHVHDDDEEYYCILSGRGTMTLDGRPFEVGPGDVTAVFPGGSHGLANTGEEDLRLIVICVARG